MVRLIVIEVTSESYSCTLYIVKLLGGTLWQEIVEYAEEKGSEWRRSMDP